MKKVLSVFLCLALLFSLSAPSVFAAISQNELDTYLEEVELDQEELEERLMGQGFTLEELDSTEDFEWILGRPLTDEIVEEYLEFYGVTYIEMEEILASYGVKLEDFYFEYELDFYLWDYLYDHEWDWTEEEWEEFHREFLEEIYYELSELFEEIGLTLEEFKRLVKHFEYVIETTDDLLDRLLALDERIYALPDFESVDELTAEQIAEVLSIFKEMANIFQLDFKFYLVKGDEKLPVTFAEMMKITDLDGYALLIELYNYEGEFLADIIITADLFGSDLIKETGSEMKNVTKEVKAVQEKAPEKTAEDKSAPVAKTEKGGKLPKTASEYPLYMILGLLITGAGVVVFRKVKAA
ncbi:processed acidic surface protein [Evansella clarkii]|uniref:processed acidic surface protein n=1 Tax=Evansella clarkii TaxID=79879 RepID=UPI0014306406|nr:processed acidic surface protein [Evansella clarkii]